jgi:hypothetical protein
MLRRFKFNTTWCTPTEKRRKENDERRIKEGTMTGKDTGDEHQDFTGARDEHLQSEDPRRFGPEPQT